MWLFRHNAFLGKGVAGGKGNKCGERYRNSGIRGAPLDRGNVASREIFRHGYHTSLAPLNPPLFLPLSLFIIFLRRRGAVRFPLVRDIM